MRRILFLLITLVLTSILGSKILSSWRGLPRTTSSLKNGPFKIQGAYQSTRAELGLSAEPDFVVLSPPSDSSSSNKLSISLIALNGRPETASLTNLRDEPHNHVGMRKRKRYIDLDDRSSTSFSRIDSPQPSVDSIIVETKLRFVDTTRHEPSIPIQEIIANYKRVAMEDNLEEIIGGGKRSNKRRDRRVVSPLLEVKRAAGRGQARRME